MKRVILINHDFGRAGGGWKLAAYWFFKNNGGVCVKRRSQVGHVPPSYPIPTTYNMLVIMDYVR